MQLYRQIYLYILKKLLYPVYQFLLYMYMMQLHIRLLISISFLIKSISHLLSFSAINKLASYSLGIIGLYLIVLFFGKKIINKIVVTIKSRTTTPINIINLFFLFAILCVYQSDYLFADNLTENSPSSYLKATETSLSSNIFLATKRPIPLLFPFFEFSPENPFVVIFFIDSSEI